DAGSLPSRWAWPPRSFALTIAQTGCCLFNGAQNAIVRSAPANVAVKRLGDFGARWSRISVEQCLRSVHDADKTISALACLLFEERLLQRVRSLRRSQPFNRRNRLAGDTPNRLGARLFRLPLDQHHATTALLEAAAEPCPHQAQVIAQDVQQRGLFIDMNADRACIDGKADLDWHRKTIEYSTPGCNADKAQSSLFA